MNTTLILSGTRYTHWHTVVFPLEVPPDTPITNGSLALPPLSYQGGRPAVQYYTQPDH